MTLLLLGKKGPGRLGAAQLARSAGRALDRPAADACAISELEVSATVHCAGGPWPSSRPAHTAVDRAETEPELAQAINAGARLARRRQVARLAAALIADFVFDGAKPAPWQEGDATGPLGVRPQQLDERLIAQAGERHLILRTSWVTLRSAAAISPGPCCGWRPSASA